MREAKLGQGLGDSQESDLYQDMYDQQISLQMSQGKGIGLADMLVQQLTRNSAAKAARRQPQRRACADPRQCRSATHAAGADRDRLRQETRAVRRAGRQPVGRVLRYADRAGGARDRLGTARACIGGNGATSFNLFGIKAGSGWNGAAVDARTTEYSAGAPSSVSQPFRAYGSVQQSVDDYVSLLRGSSRYQQALGTGANVRRVCRRAVARRLCHRSGLCAEASGHGGERQSVARRRSRTVAQDPGRTADKCRLGSLPE